MTKKNPPNGGFFMVMNPMVESSKKSQKTNERWLLDLAELNSPAPSSKVPWEFLHVSSKEGSWRITPVSKWLIMVFDFLP